MRKREFEKVKAAIEARDFENKELHDRLRTKIQKCYSLRERAEASEAQSRELMEQKAVLIARALETAAKLNSQSWDSSGRPFDLRSQAHGSALAWTSIAERLGGNIHTGSAGW